MTRTQPFTQFPTSVPGIWQDAGAHTAVLDTISITTLQLFVALSPNFAQSGRVTPGPELPAGVEVNVRAQPQKATVGDPIQIDVDISLPKGYQAILRKPASQVGDFAVLEFNPGSVVPPEGKAAPTAPPRETELQGAPSRYQARMIVALYRTGEFEFPSVPIVLRAPDGKETAVTTRPVKIRIESVLTEKDPKLRDLKKQAELHEPVRWVLWFTAALLLLIVAALAWWLYRRRRRPALHLPAQPQIDPLVLAETDLRDLLSRGLLDKGYVKQFYVLLSEIAKRILEAGYGIHTIEKTTSEIMEELRSSPAARDASDDFQDIESLLYECDLVKFAKYVPAKAESDATVKGCFRVLENARKLRSTPSAAGEAAVAGAP
jgi:hypothetical protein